MFICKKLYKLTGHFIFVIVFIFFSTLEARNLDKYLKADSIANYFSGVLLLNQSKYDDSLEFLKRLNGLESTHQDYSEKFIYTLINSGNFIQAFNYSKKLEKEKLSIFQSELIIGIYYFSHSKFELASKYFIKAKKRNSISLLDNYVVDTLIIWSNLENSNLEQASFSLNSLDKRFNNLIKIQNIFLNCFYNSNKTDELFKKLINNQKTDFSRYNYFYAKFLNDEGKKTEAKKILNSALKKYPRNLLLNQFNFDLIDSKKNFNFNCKELNHIIAEILYITANALSSQSIFSISNFYLNIAKYLNKDFHSFDALLAENFYKIDDTISAKKIYKEFMAYGDAFSWYSSKQISRILVQENNLEKALKLLNKAYDNLPVKGIYETYDFAEFLKNNKKFKESINYYTKILNSINFEHPLYPEVTDSRGVSYERIGDWKKAEKDLLASLKAEPDQAYVINYLAYSWIEQGIKIEKSLDMLKKANNLKSNDPYIIDSLGWALFKLKRYEESQKYLQLAVRLLPADPIINDHFGDALWKNGKEIQARYYWNYVLNLKRAEKDLKNKIQDKLIKGL